MFCPNCGAENLESAKFCKSCGNSVDRKSSYIISSSPFKNNKKVIIGLLIAGGLFVASGVAWVMHSSSNSKINNEDVLIDAPSFLEFKELNSEGVFVSAGLTGKNLANASVDDNQKGFSVPRVSLKFDADGTILFAKITKRNIGKGLAIYLDNLPIIDTNGDGVIDSNDAPYAPVIQSEITNGEAVITGNFTVAEANKLAKRLNNHISDEVDVNSPKPEKTDQPHNKYGNDISIDGYDRYISNLPADRRDALNSNLYNIVKNNLDSGDLNIQDATIRGDSVISKYDKGLNIHAGSFIVDIPSIKQSYKATYIWSNDENNINAMGYTATVSCLPADKLMYGNFDSCKDDFNKSPNKINRDPILNSLPHSTFNYSITANNDSGKIVLNVEIFLYLADTRDGGRDDAIKQYESDAVNWIKSKKLNPDDYSINYIIK